MGKVISLAKYRKEVRFRRVRERMSPQNVLHTAGNILITLLVVGFSVGMVALVFQALTPAKIIPHEKVHQVRK